MTQPTGKQHYDQAVRELNRIEPDAYCSRGDRLAIDFRFLERIAGDGVASERGMYRVTVTPADGPAQEFFGRFHTISRCTADGWRFILDYDGDASGPVDAVAFASGHAIEDTQPFER